MSWNFSMMADLGGSNMIEIFMEENLGYTSNVADMYFKAFDKLDNGIRSLDGMDGRTAHHHLTRAIADMKALPEFYKDMNPSNGWGNYFGALKVLETLLEWCKKAPKARIEIN